MTLTYLMNRAPIISMRRKMLIMIHLIRSLLTKTVKLLTSKASTLSTSKSWVGLTKSWVGLTIKTVSKIIQTPIKSQIMKTHQNFIILKTNIINNLWQKTPVWLRRSPLRKIYAARKSLKKATRRLPNFIMWLMIKNEQHIRQLQIWKRSNVCPLKLYKVS